MAIVIVSDKRRQSDDIGFEARRALDFIDSVIPPGELPGAVSVVIPECGPEDSQRIVATCLDLALPGWGERLELTVH